MGEHAQTKHLSHTPVSGTFAFKAVRVFLVYPLLLSKYLWGSTTCHVVPESSWCWKRWKLKLVIVPFAGEYNRVSRYVLNSPLRVHKSQPTLSMFVNCPFYCHWHNLLSFQYHKRKVLSLSLIKCGFCELDISLPSAVFSFQINKVWNSRASTVGAAVTCLPQGMP